jgi:RNA recognition motif-containing protein
LPRRDFYEPELKELMRVVAEEWSTTMTKEENIKNYRSKKLISHVKIMRDEQKTDAETNDALPSGQAFVEFTNEDLAMFAVRYLNNMEIVPKKGLIVDFSMEDQRALFKRKEKIERWRQIAKDRKREEHQDEEETQFRKANTAEGKLQHQDGPLDLGAVSAQKANQKTDADQKPSKQKKQTRDIKSINDIATLEEILKESLSRGQKQRIKKKLARLQDKGEALPSEPLDLGNPNPLKREHQESETAVPKATAKEKINYLLKRRE